MTAPEERFPRPRALRDRLSRRPRMSPNQGPQLPLPEPRTPPDDEVWFTVSPYLWATGPRIFDDVGAVRLELVSTTTFPSGVVRLCYRPAPAETPSTG